MRRCVSGSGLDELVDGVAGENKPCGAGGGDAPRVVCFEDRFQCGQTRAYGLRPAAQACEEVWLHEPGRDPNIGLHPLAVEQDRDIAEKSGRAPLEIKSIRRTGAKVKEKIR